MSDEIKVGDLVMVVRGWSCCRKTDSFGYTYTVSSVELSKNLNFPCCHCGSVVGDEIIAVDEADGKGFAPYMLKKLDPPAQDESEETKRELVA